MKNLVILAGGKSKRMGTDKVMLKTGGETFVEHLIRAAAGYFDTIYISTDSKEHAEKIMQLPLFRLNKDFFDIFVPGEAGVSAGRGCDRDGLPDSGQVADAAEYEIMKAKEKPEMRIRFVTDLYSEAGPIGGILSVFEQTDAEWFSVIPVDVPRADMRVLCALFDRLRHSACFLRMEGKKPEPLIAAYDRKAYLSMKQAFEKGYFKMRLALDEKDIDIYDENDLKRDHPELADADLRKVFRNYNTQEELERLYD